MMKNLLFAGTAMTFAALNGAPSSAQSVDVLHYWTSPSEAKAMAVVADAFREQGGTWIDSPITGFDNASSNAVSRISAGNPPSAVLSYPESSVNDLAADGYFRDFSLTAAELGWLDAMPPDILPNLLVDSQLVSLPLGIHASNWVWY